MDWSLELELWSGVLEWILGVEHWREILEWNRKLNSGGEICLSVNDATTKCITNG